MSATSADASAPPKSTARHQRLLERARDRDEPTRTKTIRQEYARALRGRWIAIRAALREGVVENDAFGLQSARLVNPPSPNQFDFPTDERRIAGFEQWVTAQTRREILDQFGDQNQYIARAYERGIEDARTELRALALSDGTAAATATMLPVHREQLQRLYARNFRALEGMTEATGREMARVLSEGLASGDGPRDIAEVLADRIDNVGIHRATMIARTEIMNSHNAARLQEWERAGVDKVGVLIAPDACPICQAYNAGEPYPASEAYGNLPKHPNCRCSHHVWTGQDT